MGGSEARIRLGLSRHSRRVGTNRLAPHCARKMKHVSITKLNKLTKLDEAIACTQALIAGRQALITQLDAEGGDTSRQREFLATFEGLLAVQQARRLKFVSRQGHMTTLSSIPPAPEFRREVA